MAEKHIEPFRAMIAGSGIYHRKNQHVPHDREGGSVGNLIPVNGVVGFSDFSFNFFNEGGSDNLLPGRPTTQTAAVAGPAGEWSCFATITSIIGAFVTDGGADLTERPLGELMVAVSFPVANQISCTIRLSDSNSDDPVRVIVRGVIVFCQ